MPQPMLASAVDVVQIAIDNTRGNNPAGYPRPSVLALSRQKMPNLEGTSIEGVCKGGYTVYGGEGKPDAIIMATGVPRMAACPNAYVPLACLPQHLPCSVPVTASWLFGHTKSLVGPSSDVKSPA